MSIDTVICPECGTESQSTFYHCPWCGYQLRSLQAQEEVPLELEEDSRHKRDQSAGGMILSLLGGMAVIGIAIWLVTTYIDLSEHHSLSAIEVTQLYTEAGFWVLVAIGVLLAGILWGMSTRE